MLRGVCSMLVMAKTEVPRPNVTTDWEMITAQLPPSWRQLAEEMGLVKERPEHLGAKVDDIEPILRLVLFQAGASASLRLTVARAAAIGLLAISHVALHKWMKRLGPYLMALLAQMIETAAFAPEKWAGLDLIAGDATTVQRPGSKGTTARVHYAVRLADLTPRHLEVTDEHGGETAKRFRAVPGEAWLLDRGYSNPPGVAAIRDTGAHIVVRVNRGTLPLFDKRGKRIDLLKQLRSTPVRERVRQRRAFVHFDGRVIPGRICWVHLPEGKAAQARERAQREADGPCDAETLFAAEFVLVFTTILHELTGEQVLTAYRARWQVELDFKRAKSIRELDRLPNFLPATIYSWICAKLLLQSIAIRIASPSVAFPPGGDRFRVADAALAEANVAPPRGRRTLVRGETRVGRRAKRAHANTAA